MRKSGCVVLKFAADPKMHPTKSKNGRFLWFFLDRISCIKVALLVCSQKHLFVLYILSPAMVLSLMQR